MTYMQRLIEIGSTDSAPNVELVQRHPLLLVVEDGDAIAAALQPICDFLDIAVERFPSEHDLAGALRDYHPMAVVAHLDCQGQDGCHVMMTVAKHDRSLPFAAHRRRSCVSRRRRRSRGTVETRNGDKVCQTAERRCNRRFHLSRGSKGTMHPATARVTRPYRLILHESDWTLLLPSLSCLDCIGPKCSIRVFGRSDNGRSVVRPIAILQLMYIVQALHRRKSSLRIRRLLYRLNMKKREVSTHSHGYMGTGQTQIGE